jgi:hypothetical protein
LFARSEKVEDPDGITRGPRKVGEPAADTCNRGSGHQTAWRLPGRLEDLGRVIPSGRVRPDSASVLSLLSDFYRGHATPSSDFEAWLREKGIPYQTFTY